MKTNLYIKPSNKQLYLDYNSNHPEHCKSGIPYSQALRVVERCSSITDRDTHLENLKEKLLERNYPENLVTSQLNKAKQKNRNELIFNNRRNRNKNDKRIRLIFTQNKVNPPIHSWVRDCKKLLCKNEEAKALGDKIQICSKQPRNLLSRRVQRWDRGPPSRSP